MAAGHQQRVHRRRLDACDRLGQQRHAAVGGDEEVAKLLQLNFEYDPQPPFGCGSPEAAGPALAARARALQADRITRVAAQMPEL
jgi:hypothetical protein